MYYQINVALNGQHFFATAEHSITDGDKLLLVLHEIMAKFPEKEGYEVTVSVWEKTGKDVDINKVLNDGYYEKINQTIMQYANTHTMQQTLEYLFDAYKHFETTEEMRQRYNAMRRFIINKFKD